ncbi:MAG: hypothetical protein OEV42_02845 [Deltaproteobacteria bacterium]|nr:hypothetical protein [Deltaproteobacteria bacterium]
MRIIIYLLIFYFTLKFLKSLFTPREIGNAKGKEGEEMVADPCCGTYVPKSTAIVKKVRGEKHYFCSTDCWKKYKEGS